MTAYVTYRKTLKVDEVKLDDVEDAVWRRSDGAIVLRTKTGFQVLSKDFIKSIQLTFDELD